MNKFNKKISRWVLSLLLLTVFYPLFATSYDFREDVEDNWPASNGDYFYYVHSDPPGSVTLLTEGMDQTTHGGLRYTKGQIVQRIEYVPFGKERYVLNPALDQLPKYTGQTNDIETDLYYYNSRYYDPVLARFIQPDSIIPDVYSPQSLNPYSYVLNNPLRYTDPSGHILVPLGTGLIPDDGSYDFDVPRSVPGIGGAHVSISTSVSIGAFNLYSTGEHSVLAPASLGIGIDFSVSRSEKFDMDVGSLQYGVGENLGIGVMFGKKDGEFEITGISGGVGISIGSPLQGSLSYDFLEKISSHSETGTAVESLNNSSNNSYFDIEVNRLEEAVRDTLSVLEATNGISTNESTGENEHDPRDPF